MRVHAMPMLARYRLAPLLPSFLEAYPQIRLEFQLSVEPPDPAQVDADVIIRAGQWHGTEMIARRIGGSRLVLCAAPAYLRRRGTPQVPDDLQHHNCLMRRDVAHWTFRAGSGTHRVHAEGNVVANESELLLALTRAGLGIMLFSEQVVADDLASGSLVALLTEFDARTDDPIYVAYRDRRHLNARVRVFVDHVVKHFR